MAVKEGELLEQQNLRGRGEGGGHTPLSAMKLTCVPVGLVMVLQICFTTATGPESIGQGSECKCR